MEQRTLSEEMGLGKREPAVSGLVAAALRAPGGSNLLKGLLNRNDASLSVRATFAEYWFEKQRFDVLVLYEEEASLRVLVIEIKVTSDEGVKQLERYVEVLGDVDKLAASLADAGAPLEGREIADAQVLYLTVEEPAHVNDDVVYMTFAKWFKALGNQGVGDGHVALAGRMLEDLLTYLGPQRVRETNLLEAIDENLTIDQLRAVFNDGVLLEKKLDGAVMDVVIEQFARLNADYNPEQLTFYWTFRGSGGTLELGYHREDWMRFYDPPSVGAAPKIRVSQVIRSLLAGLVQVSPKVDLTVRWQVEPYLPKDGLTQRTSESERTHFFDLRKDFQDLVAENIGQKLPGYKSQNYYMQVGTVEVDLESSNTLRDVAQRLWQVALELASAMDEALNRVLPTAAAPRSRDDEDKRFSDLLGP